MDNVKALVELMSSAGGWGVAALALWALYHKDKACETSHDKSEALAERLRVTMTDNTIALDRVAAVIEGVRDTIREGARR